jgi:site-specific recombinase XerD
MAKRTAAAPKLEAISSDDSWPGMWASFERALKAEGKAEQTLKTYGESARVFHTWSLANRLPTDLGLIEKDQIVRFVNWLRDEGAKPATVRVRFAALRRFFNWAVEEDEIKQSPMARMHGPKVDEPEEMPLSEDDLRKLFDACHGGSFEARRDTAMIRLMFDSGLRRREVAALMVEDLDLPGKQVRVTRKGGKEGLAIFGNQVARDLDRYLRMRDRHPLNDETVTRDGAKVQPLWLAQKGQLTPDGVHFVIKHRAQQAGISRRVFPHLFRHTFAHMLKAQGATDETVMTLGGWSDAKSMRRYGAGARMQRARDAHKELSPGDRLR